MRLAVGEGHPQVDDRVAVAYAALHLRRTPFSTLGMNCRGTEPPTTLSTNSNPEPSGSGSTSMSHTAYWPCPPDCLTCRALAGGLPGERLAQRHHERLLLDVHRVPAGQPLEDDVGVRLAHAPQDELVGLGVVLDPDARVLGREPPSAWDSLSSSALLAPRSRPAAAARAATTASARAGRRPRTGCRRSPRGTAGRCAQMSPATTWVAGTCVLAERVGQRADLLVLVVVRRGRRPRRRTT